MFQTKSGPTRGKCCFAEANVPKWMSKHQWQTGSSVAVMATVTATEPEESAFYTQTLILTDRPSPIPVPSYDFPTMYQWSSLFFGFLELSFFLPIFLPLVLFMLTQICLLGGSSLGLLLLSSPTTLHSQSQGASADEMWSANTQEKLKGLWICNSQSHRESKYSNVGKPAESAAGHWIVWGRLKKQRGELRWTFRR